MGQKKGNKRFLDCFCIQRLKFTQTLQLEFCCCTKLFVSKWNYYSMLKRGWCSHHSAIRVRTLISTLCSSSVAALKINVEGWSQITLQGIVCVGKKKGICQFVSGHRIKPQLSPLLCSSQEDMIIIGLTPKDVCLAVKKNPAVLLEQHILSNDFGSWFAHCLDKRKHSVKYSSIQSQSILLLPLQSFRNDSHEAPQTRLVYWLLYLHYITKAADPRLCCFWHDHFLPAWLWWWKHY